MGDRTGTLKSMTGFGHAQVSRGETALACEMASLNHRYFDFNYYAPPHLSRYEADIRKRVGERIRRGRVRLNVYVPGASDPSHSMVFSEENALEYIKALSFLNERMARTGSGPVDAGALMAAPYLLVPDKSGFERTDWLSLLMEAVGACLDRLDGMRLEEGRHLAGDLVQRLDGLSSLLDDIEARAPGVKKAHYERMVERLREWELDARIPEDRLQSELCLLCERSDITEETVRLRSHIDQFRQSLSDGGQVGRRLVFIAQEMSREAATIGAKANDSGIGRLVVLFKEELARVREQIENIE